jgi:hypothetical protein
MEEEKGGEKEGLIPLYIQDDKPVIPGGLRYGIYINICGPILITIPQGYLVFF